MTHRRLSWLVVTLLLVVAGCRSEPDCTNFDTELAERTQRCGDACKDPLDYHLPPEEYRGRWLPREQEIKACLESCGAIEPTLAARVPECDPLRRLRTPTPLRRQPMSPAPTRRWLTPTPPK